MDNQSQDSVLLDVVIAVHTPDRPVERAVASLVAGGLPTDPRGAQRLRINVVCHNTDVDPIRARVAAEHQPLVRFLHYSDGIKSPAGPFNHGIARATGTWVAIMGSDDSVEPGALARWVESAEAERADVLIAPMAHAGGSTIRTPVARPTRRAGLDPVRDRLSYRTAPLGLMRLSLIRALGLTFPTDYRTGEDQLFSAKLWFSGARISYGRGLPRYLVHDDAQLRVTRTPRPVTEDLAFATDLVATDWFGRLKPRSREALVTKLIRIHVFGHVLLRAQSGDLEHHRRIQDGRRVAAIAFRGPACRPAAVPSRPAASGRRRPRGGGRGDRGVARPLTAEIYQPLDLDAARSCPCPASGSSPALHECFGTR